MEQIIKEKPQTEEQNSAVKSSKKGKKGRPKGSCNQNRQQVK
jgi:hypothetical protein